MQKKQAKPDRIPPRVRRIVKPLVLIAAILLVWHLACEAGIWSGYVLPSPQKVGRTFVKMLTSGEVFEDIGVSFIRVIKGYSIAFGLAFLLGMVASLFPRAAEAYDPLLEFMRNVPPIALIALLILWFGIGETSKIIIIVLASFFPMFLNIKKGFMGCDPRLREVGRAFGYTPARQFFQIQLPAAVPDILVGMRIGLGYSWRAIIGAEMFAASKGLGHLIVFSQQMSRSDKVLIGIFTIGLVGYLTDVIFSWVLKKALHGGTVNEQ